MQTQYRVVGQVKRKPKPEPAPVPVEVPEVIRLPDPEAMAAQDTALQALAAANEAQQTLDRLLAVLPQLTAPSVDLKPLQERLAAVENRPMPVAIPVVEAPAVADPDWQFSNGEIRVRSARGQWGPWMKLHADSAGALGPLAVQQLVKDYLIANPPSGGGGSGTPEVFVQDTDPGSPSAGNSRIWVQTFAGDSTAFDIKFWRP